VDIDKNTFEMFLMFLYHINEFEACEEILKVYERMFFSKAPILTLVVDEGS
jgi:hypothetical protein